jgi:glycosyltransferase involved in cell wall biosynthesis
MRVCHVSPHLPPDQAANALLPAQLASWAVARGDTVSFVTHDPAQGRAAGTDLPGRAWLVPRRTPAATLAHLLRIDVWRNAGLIERALDEAARHADLLHLHSNGLIIEVAAAWSARRRVPYVLTLYGTEIWHYRRRWPIDPFTRAYRRASAVTFYSAALRDRAVAIGLERPGLSVVYPAVSPAFAPADAATRERWRAELGIAEPRVILNVKRLHELAGQKFLIDAFARATRGRTDVRLVVCGTGPLRQTLQDQAAAAGVAGKITFTGLIANDAVARYAAVADVFALPSLLEALPTVAVEALAAGTPVVSADHPGGLELNRLFGDDVLIVPRRNVDGLATAISDAIDEPRRVGDTALALVGELFSPAAVEHAYLDVYAHARPGALT